MCLLKIENQGPCGLDGEGITVDGEALEALGAHLAAEFLGGGVLHESPFVEGGYVEVGVFFPDLAEDVPLDNKFLGAEAVEEGGDILYPSLGHLERTGGGVEEGGPALHAVERQAGEPVVLLALEHGFPESHAGSQDFRHTALDQFRLGKFGVLELVANGDFVAGADKFRKICIDGVVGESGHGGVALIAVGAARKHDSQNLAQGYGIVRVTLVEVTHAVQQQGLRMLCLDGEILLEQRGIFQCFCHSFQR